MKKVSRILLELYSDKKQLLFLSFLAYIGFLVESVIPLDPNIIQATGGLIAVAGVGLALGVGGMIGGNKRANDANDIAEKNNELTAQIARDNLAFMKEQQKKLDAQKEVYRAMEFENPYANMQNQFAENVYEDLTVNQQQARFESQQGQQMRANIMQGLKGAAGASGIAGLAQTMASQGQLQAQRISASIGMQESQQQQLKAQGELQVQRGESAVDLQRRAGEDALQTMEANRQSTLLGISMGESAGANAAAMQAQQNQIASQAAQANLYGQQSASMYGMAGAGIGMAGQAGIAAGSQ